MKFILKGCGSQLWQDLSFRSNYKASGTSVGNLSELMVLTARGEEPAREKFWWRCSCSSLKEAQTRWSQASNTNCWSFPKAKVQILQSPPCNLQFDLKDKDFTSVEPFGNCLLQLTTDSSKNRIKLMSKEKLIDWEGRIIKQKEKKSYLFTLRGYKLKFP